MSYSNTTTPNGATSPSQQTRPAPPTQSKPPPAPPMRYKMLSAEAVCSIPPMRWMVRRVLPLDGLAVLYGPSGSGKSFLMMDLAAAVASGAPTWFGYRVTQRPVTCIVLEGEGGIGKRVQAKRQRDGKLPTGLNFIMQEFNLMNPKDIIDLAAAIQDAGGSDGLIIIDTLNRSAPGVDENSSMGMGWIIDSVRKLQSLTGGLVLLVHHCGKDTSKGPRGHSSLYGTLDAVIEVTRSDSRREWISEKCKDDEAGTVHRFKLNVITTGYDEDGEEITSCTVAADDSADTIRRVKLPMGGNQKIALDALGETLRTSTEFNKTGAPHGRPCIRLDDAINIISGHLTCDAKRRTERAQQALTALVAKQVYGLQADWLWRI